MSLRNARSVRPWSNCSVERTLLYIAKCSTGATIKFASASLGSRRRAAARGGR
jgi:hypothetical protein